jgi:NADH-quinone oxidoreductase subunit C
MLDFDQLVFIVMTKCSHDIIRDERSTPKSIQLDPVDLLPVCLELQQNKQTYFDMLSCLTGIDNGEETATMEVIYHLYSIPYNHHLALKVIVPRDEPNISTVSKIWKTAEWHEREAYDLFGIQFSDHPDLRRILLPADWEGHPLKKDYKHQDYYRGIKVEY